MVRIRRRQGRGADAERCRAFGAAWTPLHSRLGTGTHARGYLIGFEDLVMPPAIGGVDDGGKALAVVVSGNDVVVLLAAGLWKSRVEVVREAAGFASTWPD